MLLSAHSEAITPSALSVANLMRPYCGEKCENFPSFLKGKANYAVSLYGRLIPAFLHCLLHSMHYQKLLTCSYTVYA